MTEELLEGIEGEVVEETTEVTEEVKSSPAALRLCKGAMVMPLVWFIKFREPKDNVSAVAKKYFTTPGKITDIQKDNNQKYIVENMKWSKEELDAAVAKTKENFVRGLHPETGEPLNPNDKRGTATTTAEDAEYSLKILGQIGEMQFPEDAITLEEARAIYRGENPKAVKAKTETTAEDVKAEEPVEESEESLLD